MLHAHGDSFYCAATTISSIVVVKYEIAILCQFMGHHLLSNKKNLHHIEYGNEFLKIKQQVIFFESML